MIIWLYPVSKTIWFFFFFERFIIFVLHQWLHDLGWCEFACVIYESRNVEKLNMFVQCQYCDQILSFTDPMSRGGQLRINVSDLNSGISIICKCHCLIKSDCRICLDSVLRPEDCGCKLVYNFFWVYLQPMFYWSILFVSLSVQIEFYLAWSILPIAIAQLRLHLGMISAKAFCGKKKSFLLCTYCL